jgi:hypothetical protein
MMDLHHSGPAVDFINISYHLTNIRRITNNQKCMNLAFSQIYLMHLRFENIVYIPISGKGEF